MLVRLMDTNDEGKITAIGKDWYEVDIDGLPMRLARNQFVIVDADEDRRMRAAMPSKPINALNRRQWPLTMENWSLIYIWKGFRNERVPEWASLSIRWITSRGFLGITSNTGVGESFSSTATEMESSVVP